MPRRLERDIEADCKAYARANGGISCKWVSPGRKGVADQLMFLPGGVFAPYECKRPGQQLDPLQQREFDTLTTLGFCVGVVRSVDDIQALHKRAVHWRNNPPQWGDSSWRF